MIYKLLLIGVYNRGDNGVILYLDFQSISYLLVPALLEVLVPNASSHWIACKLQLPGNKRFIQIV